jgi:hypothetical protein
MYYEIFKFEVETLPGWKRCFEKRCKGTHYFGNFQTFYEKISSFRSLISTFAPKYAIRWK